jgi:serine/threonine protein kinase
MPQQANAPLPDGTRLGGYRIVRQLASGGFSIVYLAEDTHGSRVAIKEYLPSALALRRTGELVPRIAPEHLTLFRLGLSSFFEEGRALARIVHPNVVRVLNFFRANDTVYMVMAYEEGQSLQQLISRARARPRQSACLPARQVRRIFLLVLRGLREVHASRLLHLDLKPANIWLKRNGAPLLLDFGAARQALGGDKMLTPMYTPGFAAPELVARSRDVGPWTDIYAIGACLFCCMAGHPPPPIEQRIPRDPVPGQLLRLAAIYGESLCDLTADCLKPDPLLRPQSGFEVQQRLAAIAFPSHPMARLLRRVGLRRWARRWEH